METSVQHHFFPLQTKIFPMVSDFSQIDEIKVKFEQF